MVGITCEIQETVENDPRGKLHWVSDADAVACELRDYDHLFRVGRVDDQWESQINDKSLIVRANALVDGSVGARPADATAFQFERLGFYAVDPDSTPTKLVFNLTVPLKSGAPVKKEAGVSQGPAGGGPAQEGGAEEDPARGPLPHPGVFGVGRGWRADAHRDRRGPVQVAPQEVQEGVGQAEEAVRRGAEVTIASNMSPLPSFSPRWRRHNEDFTFVVPFALTSAPCRSCGAGLDVELTALP